MYVHMTNKFRNGDFGYFWAGKIKKCQVRFFRVTKMRLHLLTLRSYSLLLTRSVVSLNILTGNSKYIKFFVWKSLCLTKKSCAGEWKKVMAITASRIACLVTFGQWNNSVMNFAIIFCDSKGSFLHNFSQNVVVYFT